MASLSGRITASLVCLIVVAVASEAPGDEATSDSPMELVAVIERAQRWEDVTQENKALRLMGDRMKAMCARGAGGAAELRQAVAYLVEQYPLRGETTRLVMMPLILEYGAKADVVDFVRALIPSADTRELEAVTRWLVADARAGGDRHPVTNDIVAAVVERTGVLLSDDDTDVNWVVFSVLLSMEAAPFTEERHAGQIAEILFEALAEPGRFGTDEGVYITAIIAFRLAGPGEALHHRLLELIRHGTEARARLLLFHAFKPGYSTEEQRQVLAATALRRWPGMEAYLAQLRQYDYRLGPWRSPPMQEELRQAHGQERADWLQRREERRAALPAEAPPVEAPRARPRVEAPADRVLLPSHWVREVERAQLDEDVERELRALSEIGQRLGRASIRPEQRAEELPEAIGYLRQQFAARAHPRVRSLILRMILTHAPRAEAAAFAEAAAPEADLRQLIEMAQWLNRQEHEWLDGEAAALRATAAVVAQLASALEADDERRGPPLLLLLDLAMRSPPFTADEHAAAIAVAFLEPFARPRGMIEVELHSAASIIAPRFELARDFLMPHLLELVRKGSTAHAKLLLFYAFAYGFGEAQDREALAAAATSRWPDFEQFVAALRAEDFDKNRAGNPELRQHVNEAARQVMHEWPVPLRELRPWRGQQSDLACSDPAEPIPLARR